MDSLARSAGRLALALLTLTTILAARPDAAAGGQYNARVRWAPSSSGDVVEYEVYRRPLSGTYGAPEPGTPANSNGTLSLVVSGLDVRTDWAFSVKAVGPAGSALSNELRLLYRDVASVVDSDGDGLVDAAEDANLNRLVDAGESDPDRPDSDGDGVRDPTDTCEGTAAGSAVNAAGCSCAQVSCNDGNACNGVETCSAGTCRAGTAPSCNDGDACTTDSCDPAAGCRHAPIAGCGGCTSNAQCSDGNACNGTETCVAGTCRPGTPPACGDGNPCTTDTCDPAGGCVRRPVAEGTPCGADRGFCGGTDTCRAGVCTPGTPPDCDDGNACTTDACSATLGRCTHTSRAGCCRTDADCADADACTTRERCQAGVCVSTPVVCPDPGPCGTSRCDATQGCLVMPVADGTPCDDGNRCTRAETCQAGQCREPVGRAADTEPLMSVERFAVRSAGRAGQRLRGSAVLSGGADMEVGTAGVTFEIEDAAGTPLYRAELPASALVVEPRRYGQRIWLRDSPDPRLRRLVFWVRGDDARALFTIVGDDVVPEETSAVTLRVRGGNGCGRQKKLTCQRGRVGGLVCRADA